MNLSQSIQLTFFTLSFINFSAPDTKFLVFFFRFVLLIFVRNMKQEIVTFSKKYKIQMGILLFFVIWMSFFDEYNWLRIHRDKQKLEDLKEERIYLLNKIEEDRQQLKTLQTDTEALEKFAREQYFLKKENEEVFVIQEE